MWPCFSQHLACEAGQNSVCVYLKADQCALTKPFCSEQTIQLVLCICFSWKFLTVHLTFCSESSSTSWQNFSSPYKKPLSPVEYTIQTVYIKVMALLLSALLIPSLYFHFTGHKKRALFLRRVFVIWKLSKFSSFWLCGVRECTHQTSFTKVWCHYTALCEKLLTFSACRRLLSCFSAYSERCVTSSIISHRTFQPPHPGNYRNISVYIKYCVLWMLTSL